MMNDILLYNVNIFTADGCNNDNQYNILGISKDKISLLDNSCNISKTELENLIQNSKQSLDCENKWLTPGLIDCHTHLVFAGSRADEFSARLEGKTYQEIIKAGGGINSTVMSTRKASLEELIKISVDKIEQVINNGVTTIEIKSGYGLDLDSEKKILQVADYLAKKHPITIQKTFLGAHIVPNLSKDNSSKKQTAEEYIAYLCNVVLPDLYENNLVDAVDSFCEGIAFSAEQLVPLYQKAQEYNLAIKGHTEQLSKIGGAELICQYKGLSCDHLEYADKSIVELLHKNNVTAVLLPGAYYYLKETQKPPIDLLREYKVPIAIATDFNPGTSPILSLATIMNMACVLYGLTPKEAWQGVTLNAAKALGMADSIGSIELNKQADLVLWDFNHPYDLCYYMGKDWQKKIIKNGRFNEHKFKI